MQDLIAIFTTAIVHEEKIIFRGKYYYPYELNVVQHKFPVVKLSPADPKERTVTLSFDEIESIDRVGCWQITTFWDI